MSVTPTKDALVVALDFEGMSNQPSADIPYWHLPLIGVHSIERSAQEDTLLVLFNTAISNLVCCLLRVFLMVTWRYWCRCYSGTTSPWAEISRAYFSHSNQAQLSSTQRLTRVYFNRRW
jgi:hypothetical protein